MLSNFTNLFPLPTHSPLYLERRGYFVKLADFFQLISINKKDLDVTQSLFRD